MGGTRRNPCDLLHVAVCALEPWTERAITGGVDRFSKPAFLFLLHRALAPGNILPHWFADSRGYGALPHERGRRPHLVRLFVPANCLDRSVLCNRAPGRR